jgi:xanthine/CO dehydrogenase XdhC/CoxF family maturation factor
MTEATMHEIDRIIQAVQSVIDAGKRGIVVTIIATRGSTYRRAGARAVIAEDGESFGTISGGCLERDLGERARALLEDFRPRVITYDASRADDVIFGLGLGCRGETEMLVEPFDREHPPGILDFRWNGRQPVEWKTGEHLVEVIRPPRAVLIFGGGRDVEPVARIAEQIGWNATIVGPRQPFDPTLYDAAVIMTHNFMQDLELLEALLPSPIAYLGLLGPKSRGDDLLARAGLPAGRLQYPIGLDLGAETPEEIALSIVAEIQAALSERSARPLGAAGGPIHSPAAGRGRPTGAGGTPALLKTSSAAPLSDSARRDSDRIPTPAPPADRR